MSKSDRLELIKVLKQKGISDTEVLDAIESIKREKFIPEIMKHYAYRDIALPIGYEQTISQPYTVAFMTQSLTLKPSSKVLEIGTGSGYQAAVLVNMGMQVFSIERQIGIYNKTLKLFDKLGIRVSCKCGDGTLGWTSKAPYDGILVTAGAPKVPIALKNQLSVGGRLVIPVGNREEQSLKIITRENETQFSEEEIPQFKFVPLIGRDGWEEK